MASMQHRPGESLKVQRLLAEAVRHQAAGRLDEARKRYLGVLAIDATHAKSLHGLGLIARQTGDLDGAIRLFRQAVQIKPNDADYQFSLGGTLQAVDRQDEALDAYSRALAINPEFAVVHNNVAALLQQMGKLDEAREHFERAVSLQPAYASAYCNLGALRQNLGDLDGAMWSLERALAIRPDLAEAHNNLGLVLRQMGRLDEARVHYERAVALKPNYAEAHSNLGVLLRQEGRLAESLACHKRALHLRPNSAQALDNMGNTLRDLGRLEESAGHHQRVLTIHSNSAKAHNNLGLTERKQGKLKESRESLNRALVLEPESAEIRWNLALVDLLEGNYEAGWIGYEARHQRSENRPRCFPQPIWRGEPLDGARILLHSEQGLGDSLQFLRYVPMVQAAGGKVILNVPVTLKRLAEDFVGTDSLTVDEETPPPFDLHAPLMSLPLAFKTTLNSVPSRVPYLTVPADASQVASGLSWPSDKLRVGLVWSGNPKCTEDQIRSMTLSNFLPILDVGGCQFYSLQLGPAAAQLATVGAPIMDLSLSINDFADTAALMAHLDLILSVDTSVAHLAGALGRTTWVLVPFAPDWRWLLDREDSPWYPTLRLFRQRRPGEWGSVIERVREELTRFVNTRP